MRVLTLTPIYPNEISDSEGRSVAKLDEHLGAMGLRCATLVLRPWAPAWLARRFRRYRHLAVRARVEERGGTRVVFGHYWHIPRRVLREVSAGFMASEAERIIKERGIAFDLIHGQSIYPSSLAASILSRRHRVPFISTLRDDLGHVDAMRRRGNARLRKLFDEAFSRAGAIMVHGPALLKDIPARLPAGSNVPVLFAPNGADIEGIGRILAALPPPRPRARVRISTVCRLSHFKGVSETLEALKLLSERGLTGWEYSIVGDGPYWAQLMRLASDLGLGDRVRFEGHLPHHEAIRHMRDSDIFCMPSWREAFGNVYVEAAACGKPIIGCAGQGAEATVVDGKTGILVPPKDSRAVAEALARLIKDQAEAGRMGAAGREHIRQFTWTRTARLYAETMERVVAAQRGAARYAS